jgi:ABC-type nitrate/sulfonate/bicarbonate transport system substrate-binding protein
MDFLSKLLGAGLIAVAGLSSVAAQSGQSVPLRLAVYPGALISLPEYVGVAEGIYAKHGVSATIVPIGTGPEQIAAAASRSVDVIGMTISLALLANNQGQDLVVVANNVNRPIFTWLKQPTFAMPHRSQSYPTTIVDFKGARIGVASRGSEQELMTRVMLADAGLNPDKDVIWLPVSQGQTALAAFEAKQVDIVATIEPITTMLVDRAVGQSVVDLPAGVGGPEMFRNFPGNSRMALRSLTEEKGDAIRRYIQAQQEIVAFIANPANTEKVAADFSKASGMDLDLTRALVNKHRSLFSTAIDCAGYANVLTYLQRAGQLTEAQAKSAPACEKMVAAPAAALMAK